MRMIRTIRPCVFYTSIAVFAAVAIVASAAISLYYASPFARTWDEVDFALALDRYDLLAMQPHFPGYPYFILGGWLVHRWVQDPVQALTIFNILTALSSAVPMTLLARRLTASRARSLLLPALVLTSPYIWLMSARPMSECAGMAMLWWFLWSVRYAMDRPASMSRHVVPLMMFGFLMGTRLSFFPFGLALLPLWIALYCAGSSTLNKWARLGYSAAVTIVFQLIWVAGLVLSEGTLSGFWKLSIAFVNGHFSEWGGGVISIPMPIGERVIRLLGYNFTGSALVGGSSVIGALLVLVLIMAIARWMITRQDGTGDAELGKSNIRFWAWLAGSVVLYTCWALFGQNIEKPRHIVPIVAPILLGLYAIASRSSSRRCDPQRISGKALRLLTSPDVLHSLLAVLIVFQLVYGAQLLKRQATEEPAVYQLHRYASQLNEPFVLFTWEETRMLQYWDAKYEHQRIYTYGYFQAIADADPSRRILLTDHVIRGFEQQGRPVREQVRLIAEFKSETLFDPAYANIELYEWVKK